MTDVVVPDWLIYLGILIFDRKSRNVVRRGVRRDGSRLRAVGRDEKCRHFIYRDLISGAPSVSPLWFCDADRETMVAAAARGEAEIACGSLSVRCIYTRQYCDRSELITLPPLHTHTHTHTHTHDLLTQHELFPLLGLQTFALAIAYARGMLISVHLLTEVNLLFDV